MARRKAPQIADGVLDRLPSGTAASAAFGRGGLLDQPKKALAERALNAEMHHHLAGEGGLGNSRNGHGRESVVPDTGRMALEVPVAARAASIRC
jgi:putative transposase